MSEIQKKQEAAKSKASERRSHKEAVGYRGEEEELELVRDQTFCGGYKYNKGMFTLADCTIHDLYKELVDNNIGAELEINNDKKKIILSQKENGLKAKLKFFTVEDPEDEDQ